jgi:hypothetical protein
MKSGNAAGSGVTASLAAVRVCGGGASGVQPTSKAAAMTHGETQAHRCEALEYDLLETGRRTLTRENVASFPPSANP